MAVGAVFRFELKAQRPRIVIGDELERVGFAQVLEELEDHRVADARADFPNVDHALVDDRARYSHHAPPLVRRPAEPFAMSACRAA
jgi:hypothetical protein